jgi:5-(hydroxymethyl)furfural/furfural oxidase
VNTKNRIATRVIAKLLDGPAAPRSWLIDHYVIEAFSFEEVMRDDDKLEGLIREAAIGVWQASCSCRMEPQMIRWRSPNRQGGYAECLGCG